MASPTLWIGITMATGPCTATARTLTIITTITTIPMVTVITTVTDMPMPIAPTATITTTLTTDAMTIEALPALQSLGPGLLPSLLLVAMMGFRHGFDADHIAVVDGMTRARQLHRSYWSSRLVGLQFAAGHSAMILLASLFFFAQRTVVPPWMDGLGLWVSVAFLLVIALTNGTHALSPRSGAQRPMGPMAAMMFRATGARLHPALVGVAFALSFDSMAQAAFFAARGGELAGLTAVVLMASLFGLGMMVADAVNGVLLAWCAGRSDQAARQASRVSSAFVALIALATAAAALLREAHQGFADLWERGGVWVGVGLLAFTLLVYALLIAVQKARSTPAAA
jgi:nickel/cobalt transporter (NiCoT) family protein